MARRFIDPKIREEYVAKLMSNSEMLERLKSCVNNSFYGTNVSLEEFVSGDNKIDLNYCCDETRVYLTSEYVEDCLLRCHKEGKKAVVLNFADFLRPGGKFLEGSTAQEESLCAASGLFPILVSFDDIYYEHNRALGRNEGAFYNSFILTDDVPFKVDGEEFTAGVITCAAPNCNYTIRYEGGRNMGKMRDALRERAEIIYLVSSLLKPDVLILGAWGCGVFRNDAKFVASVWRELTKKYDGLYKEVIHPIPDSRNRDAFDTWLRD